MPLYLTNATSRLPPYRGPGRVLTIMAAPRPQFGEAGEGRVAALTPALADLRRVQQARAHNASGLDFVAHLAVYRDRFLAGCAGQDLRPGVLFATLNHTGSRVLVQDGDTLICACSRAAAQRGECHRVWASELLARAGWGVVLDGVAWRVAA